MSTSGDFDNESNNSAGGNSFWDLKQYGKTVRRLENANKLCTDLCNMIQDRVEIEKAYSNNLRKWSTKWNSYLENGPEYGTSKQCWVGFCREAEGLSEIHKEIRDRLVDETQTEIRNWQREHFHKTTLPPQHLKEAKSLEADFELAQKSWAKKLKKMLHSKRDYHQQCKMVRSYDVQSRNAANDAGVSQENVKKMEEKLRKAEKECEKMKNAYDVSLQDLNGDSNRYVEEMTKVFDKSQDMEKERMEFFKSIFFRIHQILNLVENRRLELMDTYAIFTSAINGIDSESDTNFWSQIYGVEMPFNPPHFEEYTQDLHSITKKKFNLSTSPNDLGGGVTLTAVTPTSRQGSIRSNDPGGNRASVTSSANSKNVISSEQISGGGGSAGGGEEMSHIAAGTSPIGITANSVSRESFIGDESLPGSPVKEINGQRPVDIPVKPRRQIRNNKTITQIEVDIVNEINNDVSAEEGIPVRALYDYTGIEEDELTLKEGDMFMKIEDEDEQGWCRGRKDGQTGLYPANYAETI